MITDLPDFIEKLRDNPLWWTRMMEMYPTKDHLQITKEMHTWLLASPERLHAEDWADFRRLYQIFCKNSKTEIKVIVKVTESIQETVELKPEDQPLRRGSPEYMKRTQELIDAYRALDSKKIAPIGKEEQELNGDVRPKAHKFTQTPTVKVAAINKHQELLNKSRRQFFLDAFPDAEEDEIQAYIDSFPI